MQSLVKLSVSQLLKLHSAVLEELREREVIRSSNAPTGDYAELLFSKAFGWKLESNATSGYDAIGGNRQRFQIKCRRITAHNTSRQLSALRNLASKPFDILAALLFDESYVVTRAALIPIEVVVEHSKFTTHVNAHRFMLRDSVWLLPNVRDVTEQLVAAQGRI